MSSELERLYDRFNHSNQQKKRMIGEYIHERPAKWIPRQELIKEFDLDESVITRHIDSIYEEGFILSKRVDGQRYVQWNGRGSGGLEYWIRRSLPPQVWEAGSEIRPLLTTDRLGGAYVPMLLFGCLAVLGFSTGLLTVLVAFYPSDAIFGITVLDLIVVTGLATMMASVYFILIPTIKLIEISLSKI